jgi:cyclophilin family peptidyl-prolyl cis-trans isomerase
MSDQAREGRAVNRHGNAPGALSRRRWGPRLIVEVLEGRLLLSATLQPISNQTVSTQQGLTIPLLAATGSTDPQTFTVTSSNPTIVPSIVNGPLWSVSVSYTDPSDSADNFTGTITSQLFDSTTVNGTTIPLATNTVSQITEFTNDGYYTSPTQTPAAPLPDTTNSTKTFTRIISGFPTSSDYVLQGGGPTVYGTGSSGQTGTPYQNENFQQLAFTGTDELALANAGVNTNDTQFFFTTGSPNSELGYNYTIFGQALTGVLNGTAVSPSTVMAAMTAVPVTTNPASEEDSLPVNNIDITNVSLADQDTSPNGTLLIDTTQATVGETATITITATDSVDHTTTSESFLVTVGSYTGPTVFGNIGTSGATNQTVNFKPFASPTTVTTPENAATTVQLQGVDGSQDPSAPSTLSYALVTQPSDGTVSNFNASTGTFTYTPNPGFSGQDTFTYDVTATGPISTAPNAVSNPGAVIVNVGPTNTGAVTVVGPVLMITPVPRTDYGTNTINVAQIPNPSGTGDVIQVTVNGQIDETEPPTSGTGAIDQIEVFGGRHARNRIVIEPSVTVPVTASGGRGYVNSITGGGGETREHGWFGFTRLIGGSGPNQLIGRAGLVKFRPTKSTTVIFAGVPRTRTSGLHVTAPGGTFYKYVKGRIIPIPTPNTFIRYPKLKKTI